MFMRNETAFIDSDIISIPGLDPTKTRELAPALNYGMLAGTLVETTRGYEPVESLSVGTKLMTYDGEYRALTRVEHSFTNLAKSHGLIHIPGGILPGVSDIALLPDQLIMLSSPLAEARFGSPDVMIPAAALDVMQGVQSGPAGSVVQLTSFGFADEELVYVSGDLRLHCPLSDTGAVLIQSARSEFWTVLEIEDARGLTHDLYAQPEGLARAAS